MRNGILDDAHYKAKFGVPNPNLSVLSELKKRGVELFACGQFIVAERIDPKSLSPDVSIASDAWLVLIAYQNKGYALMLFWRALSGTLDGACTNHASP